MHKTISLHDKFSASSTIIVLANVENVWYFPEKCLVTFRMVSGNVLSFENITEEKYQLIVNSFE